MCVLNLYFRVPQARYNIGDQCNATEQCTIGLGESVECYLNRCRCPILHEYIQGGCYVPAGLDQPCSRDEECKLTTELSTCRKPANTCKCNENTIVESGRCWAIKVVGDTCKDDLECKVTIEGPVTCNKNKHTCECSEGYSVTGVTGLQCSSAMQQNVSLLILLFSLILFSLL